MRSDWWPSAKLAVISLGILLPSVALAASAILKEEFIDRHTAVWLICFAASAPIFIYTALEIRRLWERSDALRDLSAAQKQYEALLRDARAERDQLAEANAVLIQRVVALQTLFQSAGTTTVERDEQ
jgi:hypothetical protein